jgi:hypothetical protein
MYRLDSRHPQSRVQPFRNADAVGEHIQHKYIQYREQGRGSTPSRGGGKESLLFHVLRTWLMDPAAFKWNMDPAGTLYQQTGSWVVMPTPLRWSGGVSPAQAGFQPRPSPPYVGPSETPPGASRIPTGAKETGCKAGYSLLGAARRRRKYRQHEPAIPKDRTARAGVREQGATPCPSTSNSNMDPALNWYMDPERRFLESYPSGRGGA